MLPDDVPLRSDLWPSIAAAIEADKPSDERSRRRRSWFVPVATVAAMSFIAIGFFLGRAPVESGMDVAGVEAGTAQVITVSMGPDYPVLREQLRKRAVPALEQLTPEERASVEASLNDIRIAVKELETALGADPTNALLQGLLVQSAQEEMRVLTTLERLGAPGGEMTL
jgi:hypothetical protein